MFRKTLALIMTLCLCLTALAAQAAVTADGALPIVDEPAELTIWASIPGGMDDYTNNATTKWFEEKTGVHVNWIEVANAEAATLFNTSIASGDFPDIYCRGGSGAEVLQYAEDGVIIPLNDLIEEYGYYLKQRLEEMPEVREAVTAPDGNIYGFPRISYNLYGASPNKLWVYKEWLERYMEETGAEQPNTAEELEAMLLFFRDNDMNGNGDTTDEIPLLGNAAAAIEGGSSMGYIMSAFQLWNCHDYYHISEDGQLVFEANTPEYRDGLSWINKLYEDGLYSEEDFILNLTDYRATTSKATPEEIIVGLAAAPFYMRAVTQSIYNRAYVDFEAIPPLKNYYDESVRETYQRSDALYYPSCFISANCEHPEAAIEWLDYWLGQEGTMKTTWYGVEGRDWEYTDEFKSLVGETPSILVKASLEGSGNTEVPAHTGVPTYVTRALFEQTAVDPESTGRTYPDYRAHMNYDPYCVKGNIPEIVWCADEELLAEYSELNTTIGEYVRSSYASFILGKTDIDNDADWQAYLDGLESLGLSRYLEVLNTYYGL